MKKFLFNVMTALCAVLLCMTLVACSDAGAPDYDTTNARYDISVETLENALDEFLSDGRVDRTVGTDAEWKAAQYIADKLGEYGYADGDIDTIEFSIVQSSSSVMESQHVTAVYRSESSDAKNVIIGTYYDNRYASVSDDGGSGASTANYSNGALSNGTGVATLLSLAEYFIANKPTLDFDVTFAFFGASATSTVGVSRYIEALGDDGISDVACMIELDRIGVDHVYAFSDARETKREALFDRVARERGLDIYKVTQKSPQITDVIVLEGVPYFQWAMNGLFPVFFNRGIPTLGIKGANWETMNLTDIESANVGNISFTSDDNLDELKRLHPDYGTKMATAATLITASLTDEQFLSTVIYDRTNFPNTSTLTKDWIWYLVVIGVVLIAAAGVVVVITYLGKKYKPQAPSAPKNIKMAVFGMDYEDKSGDNIYIDIKTVGNDPFDDIFPGVPNNDNGGMSGMPKNPSDGNDPFSDYPDPPDDK